MGKIKEMTKKEYLRQYKEYYDLEAYDLKIFLDLILEEIVLNNGENKEALVRWIVSAKKASASLEELL